MTRFWSIWLFVPFLAFGQGQELVRPSLVGVEPVDSADAYEVLVITNSASGANHARLVSVPAADVIAARFAVTVPVGAGEDEVTLVPPVGVDLADLYALRVEKLDPSAGEMGVSDYDPATGVVRLTGLDASVGHHQVVALFSKSPPAPGTGSNNVSLTATNADASTDLSTERISLTDGSGLLSVDLLLPDFEVPSFFRSVADPEFGAVSGDGLADDAAIQEAIDAVDSAGGGTVYFPPGVYHITNSVYIGSNTRLLGQGASSVVKILWSGVNTNTIDHWIHNKQGTNTITYNGTTGVVNATNNVNITLERIAFDGDSLNMPQPVWDGSGGIVYRTHFLRPAGVSNFVMRAVTVLDAPRFALSANACANVLVDGCDIDTGRGTGSVTYNGKNQDGLHFNECYNVAVVNNKVRASDDCVAFGMVTTNGSAGNLILANNDLGQRCYVSDDSSGNGTYAIAAYNVRLIKEAVGNPYGMTNILVANNIMQAGAGALKLGQGFGAETNRPFHDVTVIGNKLKDRDLDFNQTAPNTPDSTISPYHIQVAGVQGLLLADNEIDNVDGYPLRIYQSGDLLIRGNKFSNLHTNINIDPTTQAAIRIDVNQGSVEDVSIVGNVIDSPVAGAVYSQIGSNTNLNLTIADNIIRNSAAELSDVATVTTASAIYVQSPSGDTKILRNIIDGSSMGGMAFVTDPDGVLTIEGNSLRDIGSGLSGAHGVLIDDDAEIDLMLIARNNYFRNIGARCFSLDDVRNPFIQDNTGIDILQAANTEAIYMTWTTNVTSGVGAIHGNVFELGGSDRVLLATLNGNTYSGVAIQMANNTQLGGLNRDVTSAVDAFEVLTERGNLSLDNKTDSIGIKAINSSAATSNPLMQLIQSGTDHGLELQVNEVIAASRQGLRVYSNSAQINSGVSLGRLWMDNASSNQDVLQLWNDGIGNALEVDHNNTGNAVRIDHDANSAGQEFAIFIDSDNAGAGAGGGIDLSGLGAGEPALKVNSDTTAGVDATIRGRIAVLHNGTIKYIRIYND